MMVTGALFFGEWVSSGAASTSLLVLCGCTSIDVVLLTHQRESSSVLFPELSCLGKCTILSPVSFAHCVFTCNNIFVLLAALLIVTMTTGEWTKK